MASEFDKIDLSRILALHTGITERSVSRAARKLRSTQPALSGRLNRLRGLIGDPLFLPEPVRDVVREWVKGRA